MHGLKKWLEPINVISILPSIRGIYQPAIEAGVCAGNHDEFGIERSEQFPISFPGSLRKHSTNPSVDIESFTTPGFFWGHARCKSDPDLQAGSGTWPTTW